MEKTRCSACGGSGLVMGGGMMMSSCDLCDGNGKIMSKVDEIDFLSVRQTERYKKAKARLKAKHKDLSDQEADSLLNEAFHKDSKGN